MLNRLGADAAHAKIRVGLVIPNQGFEFRLVGFPTFSTYLLLSTYASRVALRHNELAKLLCNASVTML
jgi:hypothetical protein